jgi:hypothetical protein
VAEFDAGKILFGQCMLDCLMVVQQDVEYDGFGVVRHFQPDNLRRVACNQRAFLKIRITADDDEAIVFGILPNVRIALALQTKQGDLR